MAFWLVFREWGSCDDSEQGWIWRKLTQAGRNLECKNNFFYGFSEYRAHELRGLVMQWRTRQVSLFWEVHRREERMRRKGERRGVNSNHTSKMSQRQFSGGIQPMLSHPGDREGGKVLEICKQILFLGPWGPNGCKEDVIMERKFRTSMGRGWESLPYQRFQASLSFFSRTEKYNTCHPMGLCVCRANANVLFWSCIPPFLVFPYKNTSCDWQSQPKSMRVFSHNLDKAKIPLIISSSALGACKRAFCFPPEHSSSPHRRPWDRISGERIGRAFLTWCNWMWIVNYIMKLEAHRLASLQLSWISFSTKRN